MKNALVVSNPLVCSGQPTIEQTRLLVFTIVFLIYVDGFTSVKDDFDLSDEVCIELLKFCSNKNCISIKSNNFCSSCVLSKLNQDYLDDEDIIEKFKTMILLNLDANLTEYLKEIQKNNITFVDHSFGMLGWELATKILEDMHLDESE